MDMSSFFIHQSIFGKDVYVVDDHHKALAAWALTRRHLVDAPNLISIDHHSDTRPAYHRMAHRISQRGCVTYDQAITALQGRLDWRSDASVAKAISRLAHDEHIVASTQAGIINCSFSIQFQDFGGTQSIEEVDFWESRRGKMPWEAQHLTRPIPPLTYAIPVDGVFDISHECFVGCATSPHDDDCHMRHVSEVLESRYLEDQLERARPFAAAIGMASIDERPYILDIDLDVFNTMTALRPEDPSVFYRLIQNAICITVATEGECCEDEWLDETAIDLSENLATLFGHFKSALT